MLAAQNGHEDIVQLLLEFRYATSGQLVHLALKKGWDKVAQLAIWCADQPVLDWRDPSSSNKTALHIAVELRRVEIINRLLEAGVNANIKDDKGKLPFAIAMEANNLEIVKTLLDTPSIAIDEPDEEKVTPLLRACVDSYNGASNLGVIRKLLEKRGSDVNLNAKYPDDSSSKHAGMAPLHLAGLTVRRGGEGTDALLNLLLEHGADSNVKNRRCLTPLFFAAELGGGAPRGRQVAHQARRQPQGQE